MLNFSKTLIAFTLFTFVSGSVFAGPAKGPTRPADIIVDLARDFKSLGLREMRTTGLESLVTAKPELRALFETVRERLKTEAAIASFKTNKATFETFIEKMNAASAQAAEVIAAGGPKNATATKIIELIEALPGVLAEVATGGPTADVQKATDIATLLSTVNNNLLKNENEGNPADVATGILKGTAEQPAALTDVVILINNRLGADKTGKKLTIEDLIRRCLDGLRQGRAG